MRSCIIFFLSLEISTISDNVTAFMQSFIIPGSSIQYNKHFQLPSLGSYITQSQLTRRPLLRYSPQFSSSSNDNDTNSNQPPPLPNTEDPFLLLGLQTPTADKAQIKRAYKRMALKYHPDVRILAASTQEQKKQANDDFARINSAYDRLTSGTTDFNTFVNGSSRTPTESTYAPPHRRTGSNSTSNTDNLWENYVAKDQQSREYDAGGDSFGAIFSDLFSTVAAGAAGVVSEGIKRGKDRQGGILVDFVEFLEENFNVGSFKEDEFSSNDVLQTGSIQDISQELEDTKLLISQMERKREDIEEEIRRLVGQVDSASRFVEKLDLKERLDELNARKKIVLGYLNKSRLRIEKLQEKYKDLLVRARSGRNSVENDNGKTTTFETTRTKDTVSSFQATSMNEPQNTEAKDSSWKRESFGSFGRRSSSRGGSTKNTVSQPKEQESTKRSADVIPSFEKIPSDASKQSAASYTDAVPPHRRITATSSTFKNSRSTKDRTDQQRFRDIKVDEDFERLKREMGM